MWESPSRCRSRLSEAAFMPGFHIPCAFCRLPAVYREDGEYGCPYVVTDEDKAWERARDPSVNGTVIDLKDLRFCESVDT